MPGTALRGGPTYRKSPPPTAGGFRPGARGATPSHQSLLPLLLPPVRSEPHPGVSGFLGFLLPELQSLPPAALPQWLSLGGWSDQSPELVWYSVLPSGLLPQSEPGFGLCEAPFQSEPGLWEPLPQSELLLEPGILLQSLAPEIPGYRPGWKQR